MQVFKYFYRVVIMPPIMLGNAPTQGKAVVGILSAAQPLTDNEQLPFIMGHIAEQLKADPEYMDLTTLSFLGVFDDEQKSPEAANNS